MNTDNIQLSMMARITEEFLEEIRQGRLHKSANVIDQYTGRYPRYADEIRDLFPALVTLEDVADPSDHPESSRVKAPFAFPVFADYQVIREIGRGGMGVVYEARQLSLNRRVALKTFGLKSSASPIFIERFRREAQIAAGLHHTNIVPVFDVGCENGVHFFSMQFIEGINLSDLCLHFQKTQIGNSPSTTRAMGPRPITDTRAHQETAISMASGGTTPTQKRSLDSIRDEFDYSKRLGQSYQRQIAEIGAQIADALQYIHQHGIVHRDIKPSNILLDKDRNAWLADWGLVQVEASDLTETGDLFGSWPYMAPERFRGESDATTDIYSLGVTLYELLTLRPLFESLDRVELINKITNESPKAPTQIEPTVSRDFETVVLKAIEKRPAARYGTAAEFAEDLRNVVAGRPVTARRLNPMEKLARWSRNNPVTAGLMAAVALVLVGGITASLWLAIQADQARTAAELGQKQTADTLNLLINDVFAFADPDQQSTPDISLREAIERVVDRLNIAQDLDPEVAGRTYIALGQIYFNQQDYQKSQKMFGLAYDTVAEQLGQEHVTAMNALDQLGMVYIRMAEYELAEQSLLSVWELRQRELGPEHEDTIHSRAKLGDLFRYMGRFDEAIEVTNEVWEIRKRNWGYDYRYSLVSMNGLGLLYIQIREPEKAIEIFEEALEISRQKDYGMDRVYGMHNLARAHLIVGELDDAKRLCDESLAIRIEALGLKSESTLDSRILQAAILRDMGQTKEAIELFENIWDDAKDSGLTRVKGMNLLEWGLCLQGNKEVDDSIEKLMMAEKLLRSVLGPRNFYTRSAISSGRRISMKFQ